MATPGEQVAASDIVFVDDDSSAQQSDVSFNRSVLSLDYHGARDRVLAKFELDYLSHIVQSSGGNISDAARMAGVDRTTLYRLMEKHGMARGSLVQPLRDAPA
jgi:transcriptional regulator of acetoin/glycerol metabolism